MAKAGPVSRRDTSAGRLAAAVVDVLTPVATSAGLDLEGVEIVPAGRRRVLRITVDRDGGIDLDGVADTSRAFATALDADDVMGAAPYVLEVSSPGVDRPLTEPRHWRRAAGRLVRGRARRPDAVEGEAGTREVRGRVVGADDDAVTIRTTDGDERIRYADLIRGRIEVEFDRNGEGGTGR
jgi:ribosome maturation factor RimP